MRIGTLGVPLRCGVVAVAAALLALAGLGCDGAEALQDAGSTGMDEPLPLNDGAVELGSFSEARVFVSYVGGEEEFVEMGLQGGFHIFVDARIRPDLELNEVVVDLAVTLEDDGAEVTQIRHQRRPDIPDADGWPTLPELIIFIPDPAIVDGQDVQIDVRIEAVDGTLLDVLDTQLHLTLAG